MRLDHASERFGKYMSEALVSRTLRAMARLPHRPGDQTYDGLLTRDDLPDGWYLPDRFPGERPDDVSGKIDALLGYDDSILTEEERGRTSSRRITRPSMAAGGTSSTRQRARAS